MNLGVTRKIDNLLPEVLIRLILELIRMVETIASVTIIYKVSFPHLVVLVEIVLFFLFQICRMDFIDTLRIIAINIFGFIIFIASNLCL